MESADCDTFSGMTISREAQRVAALLQQHQVKVVFAESCTGGLVSGALTAVAGISSYLCGSMVVYRNQTKAAWLDVPQGDLKRPGPVSQKVTLRLANEVLRRTPEADFSLAVTGHLGPHAPDRLDGVVFLQVAWRDEVGQPQPIAGRRIQYPAAMNRAKRQRQAVQDSLTILADCLQRIPEEKK